MVTNKTGYTLYCGVVFLTQHNILRLSDYTHPLHIVVWLFGFLAFFSPYMNTINLKRAYSDSKNFLDTAQVLVHTSY